MGQIVNVNFKLDSDIKKSMEEACAEMGLSMSAAFVIYAKKVGRDYYPQTETQLLSRIDKALQQIKDRHYTDAVEAGAQIRNEFNL